MKSLLRFRRGGRKKFDLRANFHTKGEAGERSLGKKVSATR